MDIAQALFFLAGLVVGGLVAWGLLASRAEARLNALRADGSAGAARADALDVQLGKTEAALAAERQKSEQISGELAAARADKIHLLERIENGAKNISEMQTRMKLEFENLAARLLEEKSVKFLDQNQQHLTAILNPLREKLGDFRERMEKIHNEEEKSAAALASQLKHLYDLNRQMTEEAAHLANALKGQAKTQGSWGELILEKILEKSGLTKGTEYETRAGFRDSEGALKMPDVVIRLPEGKSLVIDAKVSLTAYERCVNAGDESVRQAALREHTASVRRHVEELSRKDYPGLRELQSPDFVLMFVPIEPALLLALQQDPALYGDAFEKNVILVSSSTLLVALRAAEGVWRNHKQTVNAREIARQAGDLHDAFVLFVESLREIGSRLDQARASYDQSLARLTTGRGNLVKRTENLKKLGARGEKSLPAEISRLADETDD